MSLSIHIDRSSRSPIYQQIVNQIKREISIGDLPAGTRLPAVRVLAESLGVTRLTVHNAYAELQADGWVEATVGRGTFVKAGLEVQALLAHHLEHHQHRLHYCSDMHRLLNTGTLLALAYAVPDIGLVPGEQLMGILNQIKDDAPSLLHYGGQDGDHELRVELAEHLNERGVMALPDNILITSGATQGLALVTQILAQRGDKVLVEMPTYLGQMKVFDVLGIESVGVPMDEEGIVIDKLIDAIEEHNPRFISLIPNFHNPTGILMSEERRQAVLDVANHYQVPIVEDDVYGLLAYEDHPPQALKARDKHDIVIYLSSISKTVAPGLRLGYIVAPRELQAKLAQLRWATELGGTPLMHRAIAIYLREGYFKQHLKRILPIYSERRNAMLSALQQYMPTHTTWTVPTGGLCIWVKLPMNGQYNDLYPSALMRGIVYTPNEAFFTDLSDDYYLRLCYGSQDSTTIQTAVGILAELIYDRIAHFQSERIAL